jgi:catechol 2,3-dioxygenase-like lactoylglutathione lyase family enzyme
MRLHEITIFTDDVDSVADFYQRLLDAEPVHREDGLVIFTVGDVKILIHLRYVPAPGWLPCENHVCFAVNDLDNTVAQLGNCGIRIEIPPRKYEWGRSAYLRDPDGHLLELHECKK